MKLIAQQWIPCVVDSSITLQLPEGYKYTESEDKVMYLGLLQDASAALIKYDADPKDSSWVSEDHLRNRYLVFREEALKNMSAQLISEDDITQQGVQMWRFNANAALDGVAQNIDFLLINLKSGFYVMRFTELDSVSQKQKQNRDTFFNSLKIDEKARVQIINSNDPKQDTAYRIGYIIGENLVWVLLVSVFLIISIRSYRKSRNTMS